MGIGFALAGYSSFYHLAFMMALTTIVAVNYITICRLYPNGGGVYIFMDLRIAAVRLN